MSTNDVLASIAGLTEQTQVTDERERQSSEDNEVSYEDAELCDYEGEVKVGERTRKPRLCQRELMGLQFINPGDEMSRFLPDSHDIINTNRARRAQTEKQADLKDELMHHDKNGKLSCTTKGQIETIDLCDCLNQECGGCHWPCEACTSRKCSVINCRQNRKEMIVKIEEMYTPHGSEKHFVRTNQYLTVAKIDSL